MAWQDFLRSRDGAGRSEKVEFTVLSRAQREWLILPRDRRLAERTLGLYAAQRPGARLAKSALGLALRLPLPLRRRLVDVSVDAPFPRFLGALAGSVSTMPRVGILAGNPKSRGTRYVFLVFDENGEACAVAKVGRGEAAHALIAHEADFLEQNSSLPGLPQFLGRMQDDDITALATAFVAGKSPPPDPPTSMANFLAQWISEGDEIPCQRLDAWRRLEASAGGDAFSGRRFAAIGERRVRPVVWHGDFAPWNIKVTSAGDWVTLDWERSEMQGVPGWNWLHYVVQAGVLIERLPTSALVRRIDTQLASETFRHYAHATGINGVEREILSFYLTYVLRVLKPAKGSAAIRDLLSAIGPA